MIPLHGFGVREATVGNRMRRDCITANRGTEKMLNWDDPLAPLHPAEKLDARITSPPT
jgi:hypothetical protein